jgi:hypothetical protein
MELQSEKVATRSKKEQLIDIDLRNLANEIAAIPTSPNYLKFSANVSQVGTDNPSAQYFINDITPIAFTRASQGTYTILFTGSPLLITTEVFIVNGDQVAFPGGYVSARRINANEITLICRDVDGNLVDGLLNNAFLSVTVLL